MTVEIEWCPKINRDGTAEAFYVHVAYSMDGDTATSLTRYAAHDCPSIWSVIEDALVGLPAARAMIRGHASGHFIHEGAAAASSMVH